MVAHIIVLIDGKSGEGVITAFTASWGDTGKLSRRLSMVVRGRLHRNSPESGRQEKRRPKRSLHLYIDAGFMGIKWHQWTPNGLNGYFASQSHPFSRRNTCDGLVGGRRCRLCAQKPARRSTHARKVDSRSARQRRYLDRPPFHTRR